MASNKEIHAFSKITGHNLGESPKTQFDSRKLLQDVRFRIVLEATDIYVIATHRRDVKTAHASSSGEGSHSDEQSGRTSSRSHLEEEMMVLSAVRGGANSMELLQTNTNLPWSVLRDTAGSLLKAGLLTVDDDNQIPRLSLRTKGLELIEKYRGILERIATARAVIQVGSN